MTPPWTAEFQITEEQARAAIERWFPALAPARLQRLGEGWDNTAWLVNGDLVFRFPRRQLGVDLIARETRTLTLLAPRLPLPISVPLYQAAADDECLVPFAGYRLLPGVTACRADWPDTLRAETAEPLGRFLSALHRLPVDDATRAWAPGDDFERTDLAKRLALLKERLAALANLAPEWDVAAMEALGERLARTPPHAGPTCWVHGDLYARHLVVDPRGGITGVIDWGDAHLGDPALDLSLAWSYLPPEARETFLRAYGPLDDDTWARARFHALHYGPILVLYGAEVGDGPMRAAGERALQNVLTG
jgi:aminoglycoside phosphotransferase (APT) family kinase protein